MLNKMQIPSPKRPTSASPLATSMTSAWRSPTDIYEGCGQLQRMILEYGKRYPHSDLDRSCDRPATPCLHFCYCDSIRPNSSFSARGHESSGESDGEIIDEMTLAFPRRGDMIDYISELKLNTRRSTPLHWLEPEDKLAIHDINLQLQKAFKESKQHQHVSRSSSAAGKLIGQQTEEKDDLADKDEVKIHIPRRLRPFSVRPTPRLSVQPCARCARRNALAARRFHLFHPNSSMNVVEACMGPAPIESDGKSIFFLDTHSSQAIDLAPPPSPTPVGDKTAHSPRPRHTSAPSDSRKMVYTDFVSSAIDADKLRYAKEIAAQKKLEKASKDKERMARRVRAHQQLRNVKSSPAYAVTIPALVRYNNNDDMMSMSDFVAKHEDVGSTNGPSDSEVEEDNIVNRQQESHIDGEPKSPKTVVVLEPPSWVKKRPEPSSPKWVKEAIVIPEPVLSHSIPEPVATTERKTWPSREPSADSNRDKNEAESTPPPSTVNHNESSVSVESSVKPTTSDVTSKNQTTEQSNSTPTVLELQFNRESKHPQITIPKRQPTSQAKRSSSAPKAPINSPAELAESSARKPGIRSRPSTAKTPPASRPKSSLRKPPVEADKDNAQNTVSADVFASKSPALMEQAEDAEVISINEDEDVPDPKDVAEVKAQITNAAQPIAPKLQPPPQTSSGFNSPNANISPNNTGRVSPPLVRPNSPETTAFKTLDDIESLINQQSQNVREEVVVPPLPQRKLLRSGDPTAGKLKPLPLPKKAPKKKSGKSSPMGKTLSQGKASPLGSFDGKSSDSGKRSPERRASLRRGSLREALPIRIRSSDRRPKKVFKKDVVRATSRHSGSVSSPCPDMVLEEKDEDVSDEELVIDEEEEDDEEDMFSDDMEEEIGDIPTPSDETDSASVVSEDFHTEVDIREEREKWWIWTSLAAKLITEIDELKNRLLARVQSPVKSGRRRSPPRYLPAVKPVIKDHKYMEEEKMSEEARVHLMQKEQERFDFLSKLRLMRGDIGRQHLEYRKVEHDTNKKIRTIRKEMKHSQRHERTLAERYYVKRENQRTKRQIEFAMKAERLKNAARDEADKLNEQELALDEMRDAAHLLPDYETREFELNRLENLAIEYEEQKRIDLELKELDIDKRMEMEEEEQRRLERFEEDLLVGDVREQIQNMAEQIENEKNVLHAQKIMIDTKIDTLTERESELIENRVHAEKELVQDLTTVRDRLAGIFHDEAEAERLAHEAAESDRLRRQSTAMQLRDQRMRLANENAISPPWVYSYFRLFDREVNERGFGRGRGGKVRRPNTAFRGRKK